MEYERVVAAIRGGSVRSAYVLHGPDPYQQRAVLSALREVLATGTLGEFGFAGERTGAGEVAAALATASLAGGPLVVLRELPPEPSDALLAWLERPSPGAVLAVRCAALDRRRRLVKRLLEVGVALECRPPRPAEGIAWLVRRGLSRGAAEMLTARLPASLDRYERELEKLQAYGAQDAAAVEALVPPSREQRVFDLLEALGRRRGDQALALVDVLYRQGEQPLGLLALVAHQLRLMLQVASLARRGVPEERLAAEVGAHPFAARRALEQSRHFSEDDLVAGLEAVWEAEWLIKSGRRDDVPALELALVRLARPVGARSAGARSSGSPPGRDASG